MNNIVGLPRDMTSKERSSLVEQQDRLIVEAVCRSVGHANWEYDQVSKLMHHRHFSDGSSVFSLRGKDMLLFEPPVFIEGKWGQPVQYLYDKTDFKYMTIEERIDRGLIDPRVTEVTDEESD